MILVDFWILAVKNKNVGIERARHYQRNGTVIIGKAEQSHCPGTAPYRQWRTGGPNPCQGGVWKLKAMKNRRSVMSVRRIFVEKKSDYAVKAGEFGTNGPSTIFL